jgi:hypothetical protein
MWTGARSVHGMCTRFPLQGVHRFKLPQLSDMSNRLFVTAIMLLINELLFINES